MRRRRRACIFAQESACSNSGGDSIGEGGWGKIYGEDTRGNQQGGSLCAHHSSRSSEQVSLLSARTWLRAGQLVFVVCPGGSVVAVIITVGSTVHLSATILAWRLPQF